LKNENENIGPEPVSADEANDSTSSSSSSIIRKKETVPTYGPTGLQNLPRTETNVFHLSALFTASKTTNRDDVTLYDYQGRSYLNAPSDRKEVYKNIQARITIAQAESNLSILDEGGSSSSFGQPEKNKKQSNYVSLPSFNFCPKRLLHTLAGHNGAVSSVRYFPNYGHLLLSAGMADGVVKIWDVCGRYSHGGSGDSKGRGVTCIRTLKTGTGSSFISSSSSSHPSQISGGIRDIYFSNSGDRFYTVGFDNYLRVWDTVSFIYLFFLSFLFIFIIRKREHVFPGILQADFRKVYVHHPE
jgi:WD40 repeat protein